MDHSKHKICSRCGTTFFKRKRDSESQWNNREFCSLSCIHSGVVSMSLIDRFTAMFEPIPFSGCWIWTGALDGRGYGQMATTNGKSPKKAHRVSYELFNGAIPDGLVVRHKCDIPCCVNPWHLEIGTQKDNMQDASARGRLNPISLLNLITMKGTRNVCK